MNDISAVVGVPVVLCWLSDYMVSSNMQDNPSETCSDCISSFCC